MSVIEQAKKLRPIIVQAMQSVDDKVASEAPTLFDPMHYTGELIRVGTRINCHGILKRAAVDLFDTEQNNPEHAPTLWEDIMYRDGIRIIPEVITPGLAFSNGEKGWWKDTIWVSTMDHNVWNPETNPVAWNPETNPVAWNQITSE